ncbi:MAG TPA: hypothetical protein VIR54_22310 [Vicinamibacterales bacterium]
MDDARFVATVYAVKAKIVSVLLPDGWHAVAWTDDGVSSFNADMDRFSFSETPRVMADQTCGPLTSLLAWRVSGG